MPRISALAPKTRAAGNDELPINSPDDAATKKVTINTITPTGSVIDFAGNTPPIGWLLCYGQTLDATANPQYAALYAVIGVVYGGSGINSFTVPDLRGRVVAGQDDMGGASANRLTGFAGGIDGDVMGGIGGGEKHILTNAETPVHGLFFSIHGQENGTDLLAPGGVGATTGGTTIGRYGNHPTFAGSQSVQSPSWSWGSGNAHNNVQPTIILNKIIKY